MKKLATVLCAIFVLACATAQDYEFSYYQEFDSEGRVTYEKDAYGYEAQGIYDKKGNQILSQNIDIDYQNILIQKNSVVIYSNTECVMYNMSGREKYRGTFGKSVSLLIPANKTNRFVMVSGDSIDIIELN